VKKINVSLKENSYPIIIGRGIISQLDNFLHKYNLHQNILFVLDENIEKFHGEKLLEKFSQNTSRKVNFYTVKKGEKSKSFVELNKIYSFLLSNKYGRDSSIIAIGGGVVGDLAGYAAATFMRGIQLVQVPTTLLAMVDSSIGGKTGINFEDKKNMVGAFYQAKLVLIDINLLSTLPYKEITSGLGEIIKYTYLADKEYFSFVYNNLEKVYENNYRALLEIIYNSAAIKAAVVEKDEKETGLRKILNLGHTFAHSFETNLNFKITHGEAVTAGIICAIYLSHKTGLLTADKLSSMLSLPLKFKLPAALLGLDNENIYKVMLHDKKNRDAKIKFVLLSGIGKIVPDIESDKDSIFYAIDNMKKHV
jgi:3-dehydroquinate synthase